MNELNPLGNDQGIQGMSLKQLMEELSKHIQGQACQNCQGGPQGGGGAPQAASGPQGANNGSGSNFPLTELLEELRRRQELMGQEEFANQMRAVNRAQQANGGQTQPNLAGQLVALAPPDLGQNLNIGGGGISGGGTFA